MATPLSGFMQAPRKEPGALRKIGRFLGGFGAGYQGRGPEFIAATSARDQALSQQRQQAMAQDAMSVYDLLNRGDTQAAMQLIGDRVNRIEQLGGDPSDTAAVGQMIQSGDIEGARREIGTFLSAAQQRGLLPGPERITEGDLVGGAMITSNPITGQVNRQQIVEPEQEGPPDAFRTLDARARAAGFEPGSPEYRAFMESGGSQGQSSSREREIQDLMQTFGMSRQDAISSIEERTVVDPTTGNLMVYNPVTREGRVAEMNVPDTTEQLSDPSERTDLEDLAFDPGKGTGFASSFLGAWNSTLGQLPFLPISTDRAEAAQNLRILERDAINALATSSRPAVVEQQRIIQALPQAMEWFENPDEARMKMTSFIDLMAQQYVDDRRYASNLSNPRTLREESARRANEVERTVRRVLKPEAAQQMFQSINQIEQARGRIQDMSDEQLMSVDPSTLNDAELELYIERLNNAGE